MGYEDATPLGLGYWANDFSFLHTVDSFIGKKETHDRVTLHSLNSFIGKKETHDRVSLHFV